MTLQVTDDQLQMIISKIVQNLIDKLKPPPRSIDDKMLSKKEVAGLLSVSVRSVDTYTEEGLLQSYRLSGSVRYKQSEVLASWQTIDHGR